MAIELENIVANTVILKARAGKLVGSDSSSMISLIPFLFPLLLLYYRELAFNNLLHYV